MNTHTYLRAAQAAWFGLIFITLAWDGWYAPLHTGYWLPAGGFILTNIAPC